MSRNSRGFLDQNQQPPPGSGIGTQPTHFDHAHPSAPNQYSSSSGSQAEPGGVTGGAGPSGYGQLYNSDGSGGHQFNGGEERHLKRSAPDTSPSRSKTRARTPSFDQLEGKPSVRSLGATTEGAISPSSTTAGPKRAAQACLRCRKQKLRCLGGWPCKRCVKSKNQCDFGRPAGAGGPAGSFGSIAGGGAGSGRLGSHLSDPDSRLETLEASVATLLAGMSGSTPAGNYPNAEMFRSFEPPEQRTHSFSSDGRPLPPPPPGQWNQAIPPPTHIRPFDPPRFPLGGGGPAPDPLTLSVSPDTQPGSGGPHVHFNNSPAGASYIPPQTSPSAYTSSVFGPSPGSASAAKSIDTGGSGGGGPTSGNNTTTTDIKGKGRRVGKGQKAEERLAAVTDGQFEAPFKALVYQPAVWDNREQSRRASPQPSSGVSRAGSRDGGPGGLYDKHFALHRSRDDPINTEIVDEPTAELLFNFFVQHCHPFLPIVDVAEEDAFSVIRQQSPTLVSAMLAVAARFYIRYAARVSSPAYPTLDPSLPAKLANLAECHLAQTMLRKQHALVDVQAVLLLAAWGLQSGGRGPDAWVVTGHAARIARRLGIHKELAKAAAAARVARPRTAEWAELEEYMAKWRTWLCWFTFDGFLSLGFGRPQSTQFETVDEQGFLQMRLSQPLPIPGSVSAASLYGDSYIASQVQLTQIGRDLINWGEALSDPRSDESEELRGRDISLKSMFRELNARLDDWCKRWIWSNSNYLPYLGSSARICRLQAEHMRLCLNSFALKAAPEEDKFVADSLNRGLQAAMSTIQTHHESSQTDLALSFATDYLTITLAQAAVFLIRMTKAPAPIQSVAKVDPPVVAHYLKMSIEVLEDSDMSETRLPTYLARTLRDISRAAGIPGIAPAEVLDDPDIDSRPHTATGYPPGAIGSGLGGGTGGLDDENASASASVSIAGGPGGGSSIGAAPVWDLDNFLQIDSAFDLGYLLGLPGDGTGIVPGMMGNNGFGDFDPFGGGGMGM